MTNFKLIIGEKNYSSWSLRGWLALKAFDIPFNEVQLPLDTDEFRDRIKELNPSGTVPALWHGDLLVWDSIAIVDYIAKLYPEKNLWPSDPAAYGYARSISAEMHAGFMTLRGAMPMNIRRPMPKLPRSEALEKDIRRIEHLWTTARETYGADGPFLFGAFSGADIMYSAVVSRFNSFQIELNDTCNAYMQAVLDHPAVKDWYAGAATESNIVPIDELPDDIEMLG